MRFINKKIMLFMTNVFLLAGIGSTIANYSTSVIQGEAVVPERNKEFLFDNLSGGTIPSSTAYINVNTSTNPCNFAITGGFSRQGTSPKFALGLAKTSAGVAVPSIIITKPTYIVELTAIEILAYSGAGSNRQLRINGVDDDTNINSTSAPSWDNPINIGKISLSAGSESVTITSPDGALQIKSIIIYFN
jgi:hypothetical protein